MTKTEALEALAGFIGMGQLRCMVDGCRGEEGEYFREKLVEMAERVEKMPRTYDQSELGENAVAHLHYFTSGCDWHITERDIDTDGVGQVQAFGLANLGWGGELGYISIPELLSAGAELDLHFEPRPLCNLKHAFRAAATVQPQAMRRMSRAQFEKIREQQGRLCETQPEAPCSNCGKPVQDVVTRKMPRMFLRFDAGELGRMHSCQWWALSARQS